VSETVLIAIVDDDGAVRQAHSRLLRSLGYRTETFESAEQFLANECDGRWACVISDVKMPGLSGLELQAELVARGNRTPIILVTAFPDLALEAKALQAGAHAFLAKPYREDMLAACVRSALLRAAEVTPCPRRA
jgi:FixJ family two-component response regulator